LVVHDEEGKSYTVRYEPVDAMLLNEFLKKHRKVEEQEANDQSSKINCGTTAEGVSSDNRATAEANRSSNYESSESERPTRTQQAGAAPGG
jgi:hypothetical protein